MFPGLAIMATVLGSNLMGDGLRDELDPACVAPSRQPQHPSSNAKSMPPSIIAAM